MPFSQTQNLPREHIEACVSVVFSLKLKTAVIKRDEYECVIACPYGCGAQFSVSFYFPVINHNRYLQCISCGFHQDIWSIPVAWIQVCSPFRFSPVSLSRRVFRCLVLAMLRKFKQHTSRI